MSDEIKQIRVYFYKGPAKDFIHKVSHFGICLVTDSIYSHCEIEMPLDGEFISWSSSARDGGVRSKKITYDGKWDYFEIKCTQDQIDLIHSWFESKDHCKYDYAGAGRFLIPFLPRMKDQFFCSEACVAALQYAGLVPKEREPFTYHPEGLFLLLSNLNFKFKEN